MTGSGVWLRLWLTAAAGAGGVQEPSPPAAPRVALVVEAGRPLRVSLDRRLRVKRAGQPVAATLVEPVYVHDRVVIPAGTRALGHIDALRGVPSGTRLRHGLTLDFSPPREVVLRFDRLVLADGQELAVDTRVGPGTADVVLQTAAAPKRSLAGRAQDEVAQQAKRARAAVRRPGRLRRLKDALVMSLPFHPQYLREGTVYDAALLAPLDLGWAEPVELAPAGAAAPPDSILSARLTTPLDTAHTSRGTAITAVLTAPLFDASERLLLPEGTALTGEVTFARPARHWRRHGQLRLLFDRVQVPGQPAQARLASLRAAETGRSAHLAIDDEGGATSTDSGTRFVAPAMAAGALGASFLMEPVTEPGQFEPGVLPGAMEPNSLGTAAGGFSGLGLLGAGLSQLSKPAAVGLGAVGLARSVYGSFIGKGREVSFPAGTRIQVQLAPGPSPETP